MRYIVYQALKHIYSVQPGVTFRGAVLLEGDARNEARLVSDYLDRTLPLWAGFDVRAKPTRRPGQFRITYVLFDQDNQPYTGADPLRPAQGPHLLLLLPHLRRGHRLNPP